MRPLIIFKNYILGTPVRKNVKDGNSRLQVALGSQFRTPEYIQNYFTPMKKVAKPPDAKDLRYTVDIPLKRQEILPSEILKIATPVSFDKISGIVKFVVIGPSQKFKFIIHFKVKIHLTYSVKIRKKHGH